MKAIELFAGVGGFRIGLERAGHEVVFANEWDKYACDTYDKNFGGSIDRRDLTTIPATDIPAHDIIVGGFPCQAFSIAGTRKGMDEARGTLFFEVLRIAKHHQTPYLLLENVKGLLNHDGGRTFEVILRALDELGYDCQWQLLNSKYVTGQNRERTYVVAHRRTSPRPLVFPITNQDLYAYRPDRHTADRGWSFTNGTRRLEPVEAERLQGFAEDWTEGVSYSQRMSQMGNAVTVNIVEAVADRLPLILETAAPLV